MSCMSVHSHFDVAGLKRTRTRSAAPRPPKAAATGEARCIGTKIEKTAALIFWVNVRVRNIVAFGRRCGLDGPASFPGSGTPSVPSSALSAMMMMIDEEE